MATLSVTTPLDVVDPEDGQLSLREAIIQANASNGTNTIVVPSGNYTLSRLGYDNQAWTGDLDVNGHVVISGAGAATTVIDAAGLDRVFDILGGTVTISGLTLRGGTTFDWGGGGARILDGSLSINDCVITGNESPDIGGGIFNSGNLTISDSTISLNGSSISGGGIYNEGEMTLTRTSVAENSSHDGGGIINDMRYATDEITVRIQDSVVVGNSAAYSGGGILFDSSGYGLGTLVIAGSRIAGNDAQFGGGIFNIGQELVLRDSMVSANSALIGGGLWSHAAATIRGSTFLGNTAALLGGGIYAEWGISIENSTFANNRAGDGGGIWSVARLLVRDSVFVNNSASGSGGALYALGPTTLSGCTITGNSAADCGGGVYGPSWLVIRDSQITGNQAALGADVFAGLLVLSDSTVGELFEV